MEDQLIEVTALVPASQVGNFYRWVVSAHEVDRSISEVSHMQPDGDAQRSRMAFVDADAETVRVWWNKLSETAHDVLRLLASSPGKHFTGVELAASCVALDGPSAAAGTFNWPSRYATAMGIIGPWDWDEDSRRYYMTEENAAALLDVVEVDSP